MHILTLFPNKRGYAEKKKPKKPRTDSLTKWQTDWLNSLPSQLVTWGINIY